MTKSPSLRSVECFCGCVCSSPVELEEHRRARGHFASHRCSHLCQHPVARTPNGLAHTCGSCGRAFQRQDMLKNHSITTGHCHCHDCNFTFASPQLLASHRTQGVHASEYKCCDCDLTFKNESKLKKHMKRPHVTPGKTKKEQQPKETKEVGVVDTTCKQCQRTFKDSIALQMHTASVKHKPLSDLTCPLGTACERKFTSPSALLHHLESGNCPSGMNRQEVFRMIQACDTDGIIHSAPILTPSSSSISSSGTLLLDSEPWTTCSDDGSAWSLLTPTASHSDIDDDSDQWSLLGSSQHSLTPSRSTTSELPQTLRCPLCPRTRKPFSNALAFRQHVNSSAHAPKLYHCPKNLVSMIGGGKGGQKRQFSTLSGLSQHLEAGACKGGKKAFKICIDIIQERLEQLGFGGIKVLLPSVI